MYSWSDPQQSNSFTAAQAQSQFQVPQANIGTIVAALLKQKNDEENRKEQQMQDLIKGIGSAAIGYQKGQNAGAADDSANAALYGMQNPGDPMGGYTDPNRVPDYGGTDAMKAYLLQNKATPNPLDDQLTWAKINEVNSQANKNWQNPSGTSGYDPSQPETFTDDQNREWRRGANGQWLPLFPTGKQGNANPDLNYLHSVNAQQAQLKGIRSDLNAQYGESPEDVLGAQGVSNTTFTDPNWLGQPKTSQRMLPTSPDEQPDWYRSGQDKYLTPGAYNAAMKQAQIYQNVINSPVSRTPVTPPPQQPLPAPDLPTAAPVAAGGSADANAGLQQDVNDAQQALKMYPDRRAEIIGRLMSKYPQADFSSLGQ